MLCNVIYIVITNCFILGSFPEREGDKIFNTCLIYSPEGKLLGKHRKVCRYTYGSICSTAVGSLVWYWYSRQASFQRERNIICWELFHSDWNRYTYTIFSPKIMVNTDLEFCKIGVGICYDMRFPELAMLYAQEGVKFLVYPGGMLAFIFFAESNWYVFVAFNLTTGPLHWELLQRTRQLPTSTFPTKTNFLFGCRAVDNQVYVSAVSPAGDNPQALPPPLPGIVDYIERHEILIPL